MNCRRHGSKPTLALWMLVAVADVVLIVATAGVLTLLMVAAALVTAGAGAWAVRQILRQNRSTSESSFAAESTATRLPAQQRAWSDADLSRR